MLKFTEYNNSRKSEVVVKDSKPSPLKNESIIKKPDVTNVVINPVKEIPKQIQYDGKFVICPSDVKISEYYKKLIDDDVDKNITLYIIKEQSNNTLAIIKYNTETPINLEEFTKSLLSHYRKNENLSKLFSDITITGDKNTSLIKDIPNIKLSSNKLVIDILKEDLIKLLK